MGDEPSGNCGNAGKVRPGEALISGEVQRACATGTRSFQGVEVDHGSFHAGMAPEVLDGADVGAGRQEMPHICKA